MSKAWEQIGQLYDRQVSRPPEPQTVTVVTETKAKKRKPATMGKGKVKRDKKQ